MSTYQSFYLPIDCPVCGRRRLLYTIDPDNQHSLECEKCYATPELINEHLEQLRHKRQE